MSGGIMKTTIYYFTGTGNSLMAAKRIAEKLGDCELVPIASVWKQDNIKPQTENVGFVSPMYFGSLPLIVRDFVKKVELKDTDYRFAVITRGSAPARALHDLDKLLKEKSKKLDAGFYVNSVDNYLPYFNIPSEEKQKEKLEKVAAKLEEVGDKIAEKKHDVERSNLISRGLTYFIHSHWKKRAHSKDKNFVVENSCTSCKLCVKICPVDNIKMRGEKPIWQHHCQQCLACIHFCPVEAIQYGKKTKESGRYHHPDVTAEDIIAQKG
jgi:ferredoxin